MAERENEKQLERVLKGKAGHDRAEYTGTEHPGEERNEPGMQGTQGVNRREHQEHLTMRPGSQNRTNNTTEEH